MTKRCAKFTNCQSYLIKATTLIIILWGALKNVNDKDVDKHDFYDAFCKTHVRLRLKVCNPAQAIPHNPSDKLGSAQQLGSRCTGTALPRAPVTRPYLVTAK